MASVIGRPNIAKLRGGCLIDCEVGCPSANAFKGGGGFSVGCGVGFPKSFEIGCGSVNPEEKIGFNVLPEVWDGCVLRRPCCVCNSGGSAGSEYVSSGRGSSAAG